MRIGMEAFVHISLEEYPSALREASQMDSLYAASLTHAALSPELYWKSMLPNTTMPKPIARLLHHPPREGATVHGVKALYYLPGPVPIYITNYGHGPSETKPNTDLFFLEKDLTAGHKMNLLFKKISNQASFLPRQVVNSIPFSSNKVAEILKKFAVKPGSIKAKDMKNTIKVCEESGIKGEDKYCATSLESMLDFTILKLGKHVEALSAELMKETKKQEYTITHGVKKVGQTNLVVCHKLHYMYAVFLCHKIENSVAYTVSLEGVDSTRMKAVSVCHRDTSQWNPKHVAFQMLKVKPGSVPICHFLYQETIAWVPK